VVSPPDQPNIIAKTSTRETESVVFLLNGEKRIENNPPYAFFFDSNGDYCPGRLEPGDYELFATPYSRNNGPGYAVARPITMSTKKSGRTLRKSQCRS